MTQYVSHVREINVCLGCCKYLFKNTKRNKRGNIYNCCIFLRKFCLCGIRKVSLLAFQSEEWFQVFAVPCVTLTDDHSLHCILTSP